MTAPRSSPPHIELDRQGSSPFDRSTWAITAGSMKLGPDFEWTENEKPGLDTIQGILKTDDEHGQVVKNFYALFGHDGKLLSPSRVALTRHGIKKGSNRGP